MQKNPNIEQARTPSICGIVADGVFRAGGYRWIICHALQVIDAARQDEAETGKAPAMKPA